MLSSITFVDSLKNLILDIWILMSEMSPYLLLGFLLAGLMHEFIPHRIYSEYLSKSNFRSVFLSALFGVPLPLCSCGVLPTAMGLRREGGSRGATVAFLISTPQTGVDSIIATYSLMGLPFAIIRPVVAFLTAILGGEMVNVIEGDEETILVTSEEKDDNKKVRKPLVKRFYGALDYAFVDMVADIGKWIVVGLVVAGLITSLVPDAWFASFKDNSFLSILLVLLISVPMYVCATGSIPIAVALMMKGLTPGAALVLLMAGPACNVASLLVIRKVLGQRTQLIYIAAIVLGAISFGLAIDYLMPREWFTSSLLMQNGCCHENLSWFTIICTIILLVLLLNALIFHSHGHSENISESVSENANPENASCTTLSIKGMHCTHCAINVERAIRNVQGVEDVSVSLSEESAIVRGNYDLDSVRHAIESIGYEINSTTSNFKFPTGKNFFSN